MRIGLVGYGAWGRMHAGAITRLPNLTLAGIVCGSEDSARAAAAQNPGVPVHRKLAELLADRGVELVDIVTPNHLHADMAVASLEAGRHVLLEKPIATSIADGEKVVAAVRRTGKFLAVGHELHVSQQWRTIREIIARGEIGRPVYANMALFRHPFRQGSGGWRYDPARVGSWILEEPVHYLDLLRWYFTEAGPPVEVQSFGAAPGAGPGMSAIFTCRIGFAGGAYAVFSQCLSGFQHHLLMDLAGDAGAIRTWWSAATARSETPHFDLAVRRGAAEAETIAIPASGERFELEEQLRQLPERAAARDPLVSAQDGLTAVRLCLEAERSLVEGRVVRL
jgi:myo-inositol 2-dehydrogenase / D-chiro-inositol 1-dehydrogenase